MNKYPKGTKLHINYVNDEWYAMYQGEDVVVEYCDCKMDNPFYKYVYCHTVNDNYPVVLIEGWDNFEIVED